MATKILIDGYNFLWQSHVFRDAAISDFEKGREAVLQWLRSQPRLEGFEVVIVYDAHKTAARENTRSRQGNIEVVYTSYGETADEAVRKMASEYTTGAIVISSDREVARFAEKKGCGVLGSRAFQEVVERPDRINLDPAHKLPRAQRQALSKLTGG